MKCTFLLCFVFAAMLSSAQNGTVVKKVNHDSIIKQLDKIRGESIGKPYPEFSIKSKNKKYSNESLKGKVVFINFWFATCHPCIEEMYDLNKLFDKFHNNKNFEFISFTFESPKEIELIKKKYNIHYNIFSISEDECYRLNLKEGYPTNVVFDEAGNVKYVSRFLDSKNCIADTICPLIVKELSNIP